MKKTLLFGALSILSLHLMAQQSENKTVSKSKGKVKIVKNENGKTTVFEKDFNGDDPTAMLDSLSKEFHFDLKDEGDGKKRQIVIKHLGDGNDGNVDSLLKTLDIDMDIDLSDAKTTGDKKVIIKNLHGGHSDKKIRMIEGGDDIEQIIIKKKDGKTETIDIQGKDQTIIINGEKNSLKKSVFIVEDPKTKNNNQASLKVDKLNIYPNPAKDAVTIDFGLPEKGTAKVNISDASGKLVYSEELNNFSGNYHKEIPLSSEAKGFYILSIEQNGKEITKKIIKQ